MKLKIILICLVFMVGATLAWQRTGIETVRIPGSQVTFQLVYLNGGTINKDTKTYKISPFWISTTEVTFDAFTLFQHKTNDTDSSFYKGKFRVDAISRPTPQYIDYTFGMGSTGGYPVVSTTQQGALRYCEWLYYKTGIFFRLPTEAEWEFACLDKGTIRLPLPEMAWFSENSENKFHKVGEKRANANGLYDMLGNVAEWTLDAYVPAYNTGTTEDTDPWIKPVNKHGRTVKGGSYLDSADLCTCTSRYKSTPKWQERDPNLPKSIWWNTDSPFVGFRLVRPFIQPSDQEIKAFFEEAIVL